MGDYYTWAEFRAEVLELLPLDKDRLGVQDTVNPDGSVTPGFLTRTLRHGVLDLQHFIPAFRKMHESIYLPSDFVREGGEDPTAFSPSRIIEVGHGDDERDMRPPAASRAVLPPNASVQDVWLFDTSRNRRRAVVDFPWARRFELVNGRVPLNDGKGRIAIDPEGYTFYLYPVVEDGWLVSLWWNGVKLDWKDEEQTPFARETDAADCIADYVKGVFAREIERDLQMWASYFRQDHLNPGSYMLKRRKLFINAKERTRTAT